MDWQVVVWTIAGVVMILLVAKSIVGRVAGLRFGWPWQGRRRREEALARGESLLRRRDLDEETRYQIQMRVNSLRITGSAREAWGGGPSHGDDCDEINRYYELYGEEKAS